MNSRKTKTQPSSKLEETKYAYCEQNHVTQRIRAEGAGTKEIVGWICKKCRILYLYDALEVDLVKLGNLIQYKGNRDRHNNVLFTKEDKQKKWGMI